MDKKKGNKKRNKFKLFIVLIVLMIILVLGIYNFRNYRLYKYVVTNEEEKLDIYYNFDKMIIWNKTINYIKENKKEVRFIGKDNIVTIPSYDFTKYYNFNIDVFDEVSNEEEFKNLDTCIIDLVKFSDAYATRKISLKLSNKLSENTFVDIYKVESDKNILLKKNAKVDDGGIVGFNISEEDTDCKKYLIVNVPLKDISIENEKLEANNGTSISIELKLIPENATYGKLKYFCNTDSLNISNDGVVNAKEAGEYSIIISDVLDVVKKEVTLIVNATAEKIIVNKSSVTLQEGDISKINATVHPENAINKELKFESTNSDIATVDENGKVKGVSLGECEILIKTTTEPIVEKTVKIAVVEKSSYQTNNVQGLTYIQGVLIANKKYSLPADYNPGVDATALNAYYNMRNAAVENGYSLPIISGFRSYETQKNLYNRYVSIYGQAAADTFSAQPGKSEHQTGLAFDLGWVDDDYAYTDEGKWLAQNCYKYGFIIRYPEGKESITGYKYEPWHVRYLGNPLATEVYNSGLCLEEYLGI